MRTLRVNLENPPVLRVSKTCARCGRIFGAAGREYTCPTCRQPKGDEDEDTGSRELSFRERQIVSLVREAKANKEIAADLCLSEGTIKEYLHHIFRKLGVRNRTELALRGDAELVYQYRAPAFREVS